MTEEKKTNRPTHRAYAVREYAKKDGEVDSSWSQVGSVWAHKDGKGFNVQLESLPLSGRLVIRANEPKPTKGE